MCNIVEIDVGSAKQEICTLTGLRVTYIFPFGKFCAKYCHFDAMLYGWKKSEEWIEDMGPIFKRNGNE